MAEPKIYLDSNVLVYALEAIAPWAEPASRLLAAIDAGQLEAVTSELTLAECLVKPLRDGHQQRAELYRQALRSRPGFTVAVVSRGVLERAAALRAGSNVSLPDAIHLVTAVEEGCSGFMTNDDRIPAMPGLSLYGLAEVDRLLSHDPGT